MPDKNYYLYVYGGVDYPGIETYLKRAENIIDCFILHVVREWQQKWYDNAVCAQAEYIGSVGGIEAYTEIQNGGNGSVTIGAFSISGGGGSSGSENSSGGSSVPCPAAISYLDRGGLLGRWLS